MSFYITLPSNSSSFNYPDNTQSNFNTQLAKEINNLENYEVALVEMNYAPYFATDLGIVQVNGEYLKSIYNTRNESIEVPISIYVKTNIMQLCDQINSEITRTLIYYDFAYRSNILFNKVDDNIVKNHFEFNKNAKLKQINELELYKDLTIGSPYCLVDSESSESS